jgi:hypothetical protein
MQCDQTNQRATQFLRFGLAEISQKLQPSGAGVKKGVGAGGDIEQMICKWMEVVFAARIRAPCAGLAPKIEKSGVIDRIAAHRSTSTY